MADYLITGKKGNGKGVYAVGVILDALIAGKKVATNMDIYLDKLTNPYSKVTIIRIPDVPTADDLKALGRGQLGKVEDDNGIIVIDEISKGLNARDWNNKSRAPLLDWLVHSRKLGWDVYMSSQGLSQIDKQVRDSLAEYHIRVVRTDKWRIPFVGSLGKLRPSGKPFTFPKMHFGTIRQGFAADAMFCDRKWYRGPPLYPCYDTQQVFLDRDHPDACMIHTRLSPWLTHGRYLPARPKTWRDKLNAWWAGEYLPAKPAPRPKHPVVALIMKLPADQRAKHIQRLDRLKLLDRPRLTLVMHTGSQVDYRALPSPQLELVA